MKELLVGGRRLSFKWGITAVCNINEPCYYDLKIVNSPIQEFENQDIRISFNGFLIVDNPEVIAINQQNTSSDSIIIITMRQKLDCFAGIENHILAGGVLNGVTFENPFIYNDNVGIDTNISNLAATNRDLAIWDCGFNFYDDIVSEVARPTSYTSSKVGKFIQVVSPIKSVINVGDITRINHAGSVANLKIRRYTTFIGLKSTAVQTLVGEQI